MPNPKPNTNGLRESQGKRSIEKRNSVFVAIEDIQKSNYSSTSPLTKAELCKRAGVSKTFIRDNPEIDEVLTTFITANNKKIHSKQQKAFTSDSKDVLISTLKKKIKSQDEEIIKLKEENKILYGKLSKLR